MSAVAVARKEAAAGYKAKYTAAAKGKATQRRKEIKKSVSRYCSGNRPTIPSWTQTRDGVHDIAATFYEAACSIANNKSLAAARGTLQGEELATFDARLALAAAAAEAPSLGCARNDDVGPVVGRRRSGPVVSVEGAAR